MLKPYLRPWIPAIRKLALGRCVSLTDKEVESILRDADLWLYRHDTVNFSRQTCKPETIACAIKAVFKDTLEQRTRVAGISRSVFNSDNYQNFVHNSVIPRREYMDLFARR